MAALPAAHAHCDTAQHRVTKREKHACHEPEHMWRNGHVT